MSIKSLLPLSLWPVALVLVFYGRPLAAAGEWLVIQPPNQPAKVWVADQVEEKEGIITLRNEQGAALGAWQKEFVVGRAPLPPRDRSVWSSRELQPLVDQWESFRTAHPAAEPLVGPVLQEARAFIQNEAQKEAAATALKQETLAKDLESVLAIPAPTPEAPPALEALDAHMRKVRKLMIELPGEAARLEDHIKPWTEIHAALAEGRTYFEGAWKTADEIESIRQQRQREEAERIMARVAAMEIPGVVIPAQTMSRVRIGVLVSVGLGFLAFVSLLMWRTSSGSEGRSPAFWIKIPALFASLGLLAYEGYLIQRLWLANTAATATMAEPASPDAILRMLYAASRPKDLKAAEVPREAALAPDEINGHLSRHLVFNPGGNPGDLARTAWSVELQPGAILIRENLRCDERTWTATYEIEFIEDADGTRFSTGRVLVNGIQVPKLLGSTLWNNFQAELTAWARKSQIQNHYQFAGVENGRIVFRLTMMPPVQP